MKKLPILLALSLCFSVSNAEQISEFQAASIARKYLPAQATTSLKALRTSNTSVNNAEYYIFNSDNNNGYVIVSGDDELTELVGYADKGAIPTHEEMPENLKFWLGKYAEYVKSFRDGKSMPQQANYKKATVVVEPLIKTLWDQMNPYNDLCPYDRGARTKCPTGCAATAFAQVMNFWEWPKQGTGSHTYNNNYGIASVNFSQSIYDWENMLDYYKVLESNGQTTGAWNRVQADAVAKLMYDCGVAINMDYAPDGSGTTDNDIVIAATNYFQYDAEYIPRDAFTSAQFMNKMKDALKKNLPILFGGIGDGGGHEFVADGLDSNDFFHINWGWSGISDGYFNMDYMNPSDLGTGGGAGGFCYEQSAVIITPNRTGNAKSNQNYLNLIPEGYYGEGYVRATAVTMKGNPLGIHVSGIWNVCGKNWEGETGVAIFNGAGERLSDPQDTKALGLDYTSYVPSDVIYTLKNELMTLEDGIYYIYPVSREDRKDITCDWIRMVTRCYQAIEVSGDQISTINPELYVEVSKPIECSQSIFKLNERPIFSVTLFNPTPTLCEGNIQFEIREVKSNKLITRSQEYLMLYDQAYCTFDIPIKLNSALFKEGETYNLFVNEKISTISKNKFKVAANANNKFLFTITDPAGVGETVANAAISVYPNPATDFVNIESDEELISVKLFSADGRLIQEAEHTKTLDLSNCPSGYYMLFIQTEKGSTTQQLLKK